jgi:hypothetical protein
MTNYVLESTVGHGIRISPRPRLEGVGSLARGSGAGGEGR